MLGRTIQNYRIEELLGEGGMGTVYRATDMLLRRQVALKMLHHHLVRDNSFMERFQNEAILSAQLNHPNVTTLYNFFQFQHEKLIVMELVSGVTVDRLLRQHGRLSPEAAVRIVLQTLDGLHHAHSRGILHRDIKAANLMLTPDGVIKLMDFGIARLEGSARLTRADRIVGTLEYMAPELLSGGDPSVQSDLYAAGILLYELLCGQMPFEPGTEAILIQQILNKKPVPLKNRVSGLPKALDEVLDRLLQKRPDRRFRDAPELKRALSEIVPPGPIDVVSPAGAKAGESRCPPGPAAQNVQASQRPRGLHINLPGIESLWNTGRQYLWSMEGAVVAGAVVVAAGIIGVWAFSERSSGIPADIEPAAVSLEESSPVPLHDNVRAAESVPAAAVIAEEKRRPQLSARNPAGPGERGSADISEKPVPEKKPATRTSITEAKTPQEPPRESVAEASAAVAPARTTREVSVNLRGDVFTARLSQTLSSEISAAGQVFWMETVSSVQAGGTTVISSGARVRGKVERVASKADNKRAGLWITLEAVEAVDGQWIPVNFRWSDTAFHPVELNKGFYFKKIRTGKVPVTIRVSN